MKSNDKQESLLKKKISDFRLEITKKIQDCNQVFLTGHKNPDFDSIASLAAMALICKKNKKAPYIIMDENFKDLPDELVSMVDSIKEKFIFITNNDYENNKTDNDLLILVDVNKGYMTSLDGKYKQFSDVLIVDHHNEDDKTIKSSSKLIVNDVSSTSEMLYYLLKQYGINSSDLNYYTFLLAGIYLDTNKCSKNMYPSTYAAIKGLIEKGADQLRVEELFSLDFDSDRRVHRLIDKAHFANLRIAIAINGDEIYTKEEVAQTADHMLKYNCDVGIAGGKNKEGTYYVSARTKNATVGIANIMSILNGGGGNSSSASCPPIYVDGDNDMENAKNIEEKILQILFHKY